MRHIKQVISDSCIYGGLIQTLHHTLMSGGVFESAPLFVFKEEKMEKKSMYQTIQETSRTTGLSQYYLRQGVKNGTIPHVNCGRKYYINVPAMLERLASCEAAQPLGEE